MFNFSFVGPPIFRSVLMLFQRKKSIFLNFLFGHGVQMSLCCWSLGGRDLKASKDHNRQIKREKKKENV